MKSLLLMLLLLNYSSVLNSCENPDSEQTVRLTMVDPDATAETKALYANLWLFQQKGVIFGHHDYPAYGVGWKDEPGRSDVKDITGDHPGVYSLDMRGMDQLKINFVKEAYKRGGVSMICWHQFNPLTEAPGAPYPKYQRGDITQTLKTLNHEPKNFT